MTTTDTIAAAFRDNLANARTKAGREFAQGQLDAYLARKPRKPCQPSPFSRFVEMLENTQVQPR